MNKTAANCICFKGYSGLDCEIVSEQMKVLKRNVNIIVYVVIIVFVVFVVFIVGLDILGCHIKRKKGALKSRISSLSIVTYPQGVTVAVNFLFHLVNNFIFNISF